jgi:hypothetical protein
MKPEIVTIAMRSPAPNEYSNDARRPRPLALAERLHRAEQVWRTRPDAIVRFVDPAPRRSLRRTLRELEQQQARVDSDIRFDKLLQDQRVLDAVANRREARLRKPRLPELRARLERATT